MALSRFRQIMNRDVKIFLSNGNFFDIILIMGHDGTAGRVFLGTATRNLSDNDFVFYYRTLFPAVLYLPLSWYWKRACGTSNYTEQTDKNKPKGL